MGENIKLPPPPTKTPFKDEKTGQNSTVWTTWLFNLYRQVQQNMSSDFYADIAAGNIPGHFSVNKFGAASSGIQTSRTDIWDRADATPTQQIWLAPTAARVHQIASTSVNDAAAGTGGQTMRVYGLTSWDTAEVSEDISLNGVTNVPTTNSYVIIHRMKLLTWGSGGTNAGIITATADTDTTITAQINIAWGQTEMAIYGIPSIQTAYMTKWRHSINKSSGAAADATFYMVYNPNPDDLTTGFIVKDINGLQTDGITSQEFEYMPPKVFEGPGILKIQSESSVNDLDGDSSFDMYLVNN